LIIARPLVFSIVAPTASYFTLRAGERRSGVVGSAALIGSMVVLAVVGVGTSDLVIIAGLALSGIGQGIASPALSGLVANAVDSKDIGTAAAVQQLMTQMGAVIGTTIMVSVHEATLSQGVVESYGYALLAGAFAAGLGVVCAARVQPLAR
jgi:MFS family permease